MGCPLDVAVVETSCVTITSSLSCACSGAPSNTNRVANQMSFIGFSRSRVRSFVLWLATKLVAFSVRLSAGGRRQDRHPEHRRPLIRTKRAGNLVGDRGETAQILDDGGGIGFRQRGVTAPRHAGGKDATVGPHACLNSRYDLVLGPSAEACIVVGREVGRDEGAQAGHLVSQVRTSQEPGRIRPPEKVAGRVAVAASAEVHEIFSARDLCALAVAALGNSITRCNRQTGQQGDRQPYAQLPRVAQDPTDVVAHLEASKLLRIPMSSICHRTRSRSPLPASAPAVQEFFWRRDGVVERRTALSISLRPIPISRSIRSSCSASSATARRARNSALKAVASLDSTANRALIPRDCDRVLLRVLIPCTA